MAIVLYNAPRSSASRRVRLCLEEKGLPYDDRAVGMERLEHHSPSYLEINPNGVVPTMLHMGKPLHESGTICEYLDESFPDPPLKRGSAVRKARRCDPVNYRVTAGPRRFALRSTPPRDARARIRSVAF